ncbi:catalase family peroxidase [Neomesorhizobium albiziae]|uniref:catalase family peroxidase n=1 Tax=Neomesorhizobium albiziae TaxID=335020 RepID=UPI001AEEF416|nr:catalase family peroxidase [Mesorhizobium albiziae]
MKKDEGPPASGEDRQYDEMLDALYATFGRHPGFRVTHAKGVLATGSFTASAVAGLVTRAAHMQGAKIPVTVRFSNFSGIPSVGDGDPTADPRGLALRFDLGDGAITDIVAHSFDGFPVGTPQQFLQFLKAIAAAVAEPGDPTVLERFVADHPSAKRYLDAPKPAPRSYAGARYFGVNAYKFVNAEGLPRFGRYRIDPAVAEPNLDDAERAAAPGDFLADDLRSRLLAGPVTMRLMLQMARAGDDVTDGSVSWPWAGPDAREEIELGTITLTDVVEPRSENERIQEELYFSPGRLVDGIEPSADPMILARSRIYEMAFARRHSRDRQPTADAAAG